MTTTEVPAPPRQLPPRTGQRSCHVCGLPSDAAECISCVIANETWAKRRADR